LKLSGSRRRWTAQEKERIVVESFALPRNASSTARRHVGRSVPKRLLRYSDLPFGFGQDFVVYFATNDIGQRNHSAVLGYGMEQRSAKCAVQ